ncbi:membrane-bound PQQ-dependent dehydrogenase, glucose/quinate/shikimate family [Paradevosia shaoguanensis]|uniref:membrane-bound PQQ-dependent dehydrogenase, glucose/quinate/shikimate family n=1 Tax=Paradevosia shaoguanensis TaxID=1335043 RepID=UPI001932EE9D|nr:membrane-bound PQQ-dependent dehydrogenase, glucose/quinate/shikimate family [Paradevosia shaoguanensis]
MTGEAKRPVGRGFGYWASLILAAILIVVGLPLLFGGVWLALLGGSWYYAIAGLGVIGSGVLLFMGRRLAVLVYAVTWLFTLVWALWEAGLDGWAQVPRLVGPTVLLVLVLLTIPVLRRRDPQPLRWSGTATAAASFAVLAIGIMTLLPTLAQHNPAFAQTPPAATPTPPAPTNPQPQPEITPALANAPFPQQPEAAAKDWPAYGGTQLSTRYSSLDQITPDNVGKLKEVWTYETGDMPTEKTKDKYSPETTPIKVGDTLYLCSATNIVLAVDAATGREIWRFDPHISMDSIPYGASCRGVSYYKNPSAAPNSACVKSIIEGTLDGRLIAVDAEDGKPCEDFGRHGEVNLLEGIGHTVPGWYSVTAPPAIVRNVVVTGAQVQDGQAEDAPSGVIRGYDAVSGKLLWAWDMGRPDQTGAPVAGETYTRGTPNMWTAAAGDDALGLVYLPLGNSSVDYFGGNRKDYENEFSSSVVAVDVTTGKPAWHFQTVHYDVWDYDLGSQPTLVDFPTDKGNVPALILASKQGQIYVLDRRTGEPLTPVEERKVPAGGVEPDKMSPTQPFSGYANVVMPDVKESDMWGMSPLDQLWCRIQYRQANYQGPYTPPSADKPFLEYPSYNGGSDWGSVAVDPDNGILVVNYNDMVNYDRLIPREEADKRGWRPIDALGGPNTGEGEGAVQVGAPWAVDLNPGWKVPFTGMMCKKPPYGGIRAIDLKTGKTLWDHPFGDARANGPFGLPSFLPIRIGTPNNGGAVLTKGGLIFIAATTDNLLRAIDIKTGEVKWSTSLPAGGQANPMTFEVDGQQVVAIFAGGHHFMKTPVGDDLVAYALPKDATK